MGFDYERLLATGDKRHWVRVTHACNNKCIFCLDMNNLDGTQVPHETVLRNIEAGRRLGATRLILSGGEATMNPRFIEYVRYGKEMGYERIQTVSNGRMYSRQAYLEELVEAGLGEITFSVHGHTEELHDDLVVAKGAWKQINKGIDNAVALRDRTGTPIVSIDIVITKENYRHIHEIIEMFAARGVHEYDLMHLTPFGNADMERDQGRLFIDIQEAYPYLQKAFAYARKPGFYIWTNRFPTPYLEGYEDLIQDPRKLKDEVNGRLPLFEKFFEKRIPFPCKGWRCPHCHMRGLCEQLHEDRDRWDDGTFRRVWLPLERMDTEVLARRYREGRWTALEAVRLSGVTMDRWSEVLPWLSGVKQLELYDCTDRGVLEAAQALGISLVLYYSHHHSLQAVPILSGVEYKLELTRHNKGAVALLGSRVERSTLVFPNYEVIDEELEGGVDPEKALQEFVALYARLRREVRFENVPRCLFPAAVKREGYFDLSLIQDGDSIDLFRYIPYYVSDHHYDKAVGCGDCSEESHCEGFHINHIRTFGLKRLRPLSK